MSKLLLLLLAVHDTVHDLPMKSKKSRLYIHIENVDLKVWYKLSETQQEDALSKEWYVYYFF